MNSEEAMMRILNPFFCCQTLTSVTSALQWRKVSRESSQKDAIGHKITLVLMATAQVPEDHHHHHYNKVLPSP